MPPHRAPTAHNAASQYPEQIAHAVTELLTEHAGAVVVEDGKFLFHLRTVKHALSTEHGRCSLHLWNDERNVVRNIVAVTARANGLRLSTKRLGHAQPKMLELASTPER